MAEKSGAKGKRRGYAKIDEDNDVFLSFINKKKRNNKKKLTEIEELEKRDSSTLKPEQFQKLKKKPEISKENDYWHEIKDLYYQALKTNQEEGGKRQPLKKDSTAQEKAEPKVEAQTTTATTAHVHHHKADIIRPVVGLLHLHQLFASPVVADEFDKVYMNISGSLGFTTFPELKAVHEFSDKVFKVGASQTAGKGLDDAVAALEQYIDASNSTAAAGKSYAYVSDVVGKLVASDFFRQHKAVEHKHHKEHHAHGTHEDHKHEQPKKQETPKQEAPKQEAPKQEVKQTKPESPVKTQPEQKKEEPVVQSSKKEAPTTTTTTTQQKEKEATRPPQENTENWENFEDDEEEEEEYDEGEEEHEEKKVTTEKKTANPDDGFVEVKAKYLEKRTDGGPVRGERRGRGRRGGRRGGEGADRGDRGGERRRGRRRGGDGQEGGEGGYRRGGWRGGEGQEGQEGGYRRGGRRGEGYRGGNRRGGNQEYVPKKQEGTTQPQTQTQP